MIVLDKERAYLHNWISLVLAATRTAVRLSRDLHRLQTLEDIFYPNGLGVPPGWFSEGRYIKALNDLMNKLIADLY